MTSFNTHTLCHEALRIYLYLKEDNSLERFYDQYIPIIIQEILYNLHKDDIAKKILGKRLDKYINILELAMINNSSQEKINIFETNIRNLLHFFDNKSYYNGIITRLEECIKGSKNQGEIINLTNSFACELVYLGYSKQHIYNTVKDWFDKKIDSKSDVHDFFKSFTFEKKDQEIITFVNRKLFSYYNSDLKDVISMKGVIIEDFSNDELFNLISKDSSYKWIQTTLENLNNISCHVSLIKATIKAYDPYTAYSILSEFIKTVNNLVTMFDNELKTSYSKIACLNYPFRKTIAFKRPMEKRLRYYGQNYAQRTAEVIKKINMSKRMFNTFIKMLSFHSDALEHDVDNKYTLVMLWTSLEALFVNNNDKSNKSTLVINSLIEIIQRTYLIKTLKYLHDDFIRHLKINKSDLIKKYNLNDIDVFMALLFDCHDSDCMKEVCCTLEKNPLLRSRIFQITNSNLRNADLVNESLHLHRQKITWQISRTYRVRNLIVHSGRCVPYIGDLVEHLHNYLDFIINYIVCKVENNEAISDIRDIVEEVKIDNELHHSILKKNKGKCTKNNSDEILFGPSKNVVDYYRNTIV